MIRLEKAGREDLATLVQLPIWYRVNPQDTIM